ncbi:sulfurtransferase [Yoonia sp.]|uniref:sulfurtransferase n=1 Tax=Yoonia sp. TaxID=2212373 RepID=UPI00391AD3F6
MIRSALVFTATLAFAAPAIAQTDFGPLVSAEALSTLVEAGDVTVLDIRGDAYGEAHIPGAISGPYALFRGPADNPGALPAVADLEATLRSLGITTETAIVVVHEGTDETDFGAAARVYWTLKSSGVSDLAILNGGQRAWTLAELPTTDVATEPTPSSFDLDFSDQWLATTDEVVALVDSGSALLLDARPQSFWEGEDAHPSAARPGTLPQSQYFEHSNWFSSGPSIVNADAARQLAADQGFTGQEELVSFCNTGHWAATNWFALSELAGVENVKLYPESMVGYSQGGHQMANVPGVFRNLLNQFR